MQRGGGQAADGLKKIDDGNYKEGFKDVGKGAGDAYKGVGDVEDAKGNA